MRQEDRTIIKEAGKNGEMVYRYQDFEKEINVANIMLTGDLDWRFALIMDKFKLCLDLLNMDDEEERTRYNIVLSAIIKDAERDLSDISDFISKAFGNIAIIYNKGPYRNFQDQSVAGLVFRPADIKAGGEVKTE